MTKHNLSLFTPTGEHGKELYGVEQSCHGHLYRWIFTKEGWLECSGDERPFDDDGTQWIDIGCPIGGSNSSATFIQKLSTLDEVKAFLLSSWETDLEDPELVDIAEGIYTIDTDDEIHHAITSQFVELFQIPEAELTKPNSLYATAVELIRKIRELDTDNLSEIDYENPFYGGSRDMRLSELEDICDKLKAASGEKNHAKNMTYKGIVFNDVVYNEHFHSYFVRVCDYCCNKYGLFDCDCNNISRPQENIRCSVVGCENKASYYVDFDETELQEEQS